MIEPLRLSLVVGCSCEAAFRTWTERTSLWWPTDHTATGDADSVVTFEPFVGGRVYERTPGGAEVDWGRIVVWEPPRRLAYLWHLRVDRADATDVEITFTDGRWGPLPGRDRAPGVGAARRPRFRSARRQSAGMGRPASHFVAACSGPEASGQE